MPKFMIDYSDYQKLIEIAKETPTQSKELNIIINKYSVSKLINEIKVKLFNDVKQYKKGTEENKKAYDKYNRFKCFTDNLKEHISNDEITIDMLITAIKEQELEITSMETQVLP